MRYLIFILIAMIVVTLVASLYGWYRHLRDDEDDLYYSSENPIDLKNKRTPCIQPAANLRQRDHATTAEALAHSFHSSVRPMSPPLMRQVMSSDRSRSDSSFRLLLDQNQEAYSTTYAGYSSNSAFVCSPETVPNRMPNS